LTVYWIADLIVIGIIALLTIRGFRNGLTLSLIRILSVVLSIILTWFIYPYILVFFGANPFVNLLILIALFILCLLLIRFIAKITKVVTRLPVIKQLDKLGGGIFGFLQGAVIIYAVFALLLLINPVGNFAAPEQFALIHNAIDNSTVASVMYNNNFVLNMFAIWMQQ